MSFQSTGYSSRSFSGSSALSLSGGMQRVSGGQMLISTGRAPSVYAGAGGYGTRISQSIFSSGSASLAQFSDASVINNEKVTMQNLNDRLASYLEKVRSLEAANRKLELQIREFYEKRAHSVSKDFTAYFFTITDIRAQMVKRHSDNQSVVLRIDNTRLAMDDFKMKYETELNVRTVAEADVTRLRGVRDSLTLSIGDLEMQVEGLKEELVYIKSNHQEELRQLRIQQTGNVSVEVDSVSSVDLAAVLQEVREQYEALMVKNKLELERWFQTQVETFQTCTVASIDVKTFVTQLSELKRTYQSLEITRQGVFSQMQYLKQNVQEVNSRYSIQLSQLQATINMLEMELQRLKVSIEQQQSEYKLLLDIKMRLELEIAEYRRLLEGEVYEKKSVVVVSKVVEKVEEHKPHVERRVKTIVEEIVDGKVVSSVVDTQVEDIQQHL